MSCQNQVCLFAVAMVTVEFNNQVPVLIVGCDNHVIVTCQGGRTSPRDYVMVLHKAGKYCHVSTWFLYKILMKGSSGARCIFRFYSC